MTVFQGLQRTFVRSFYRQNALFFGGVLFFFVGVVRPPTFFFSADFVGNLLREGQAVAAVLGLAGAYFAYAMRFLLIYPTESRQQFLHVLPALGVGQLRWQMLGVVGAVMGPVIGYLLLMVGYAWQMGLASGIPVALAALAIWVGGGGWLAHRMLRPLAPGERRVRWRRVVRRTSLPVVYWGILWRRHRSGTLVVKLVSVALLLLLLVAEAITPNPYALVGLTFLLVAVLHAFLLYRLRESEELELSWFRNLPFSTLRKWLQWGATIALLCLPEIALLLLMILREGLSPGLLLHFGLAVAGFGWLAIGLTYLKQVRPQDLTTLTLSLGFGIFIALLFQVSFWLLYLPVVGLAGLLYGRLSR
ncbi:MAG: hypothetical protein AAF998_20580 [Bacteroidota bacterium]